MKPVFRNILAVIAGIVVGSAVNMGLILMGSSLVPPPPGVDVTDVESIADSMHLFEARHFIFPFLAHALGTFVGAMLAAFISVNQKMNMALCVGGFFLIGGIANAFSLPAPLWFVVLDLVGAYFPMAYLAGKMALSYKRGVAEKIGAA